MIWLIAVWLISAAVSFWMLTDWWREDLDVTIEDIVVHAAVSVLLGPLSLTISLPLWAGQKIGKHLPKEPIWRKK